MKTRVKSEVPNYTISLPGLCAVCNRLKNLSLSHNRMMCAECQRGEWKKPTDPLSQLLAAMPPVAVVDPTPLPAPAKGLLFRLAKVINPRTGRSVTVCVNRTGEIPISSRPMVGGKAEVTQWWEVRAPTFKEARAMVERGEGVLAWKS